MTSFPGSPRLIRGGIVLLDPVTTQVKQIITLQYNPDSLNRTLQIQGAGEAGDRMEAMRLKGPPVETIKLEAEIDATDQLEMGNAQTIQYGIYPQLAALETIAYPTSAELSTNNDLARSGMLEIAPMQAPTTLFVWSINRIFPVRITEFNITEEAFDPALNPIRAKVSLGMRVLSVNDIGFDNRGGNLFMKYLQQKERLAQLGRGMINTLGIQQI